MVKKIVVLGPESTGKSTLCEALARHYSTIWCPEYAREYLLKHGTTYNFDDLLTIAKGQLALEEKYLEEAAKLAGRLPLQPVLLFLDTDQYVMKVWCEYVFGDCHNWILNQIAERPYDLYLLCKPDLPWVKDELREYPDEKPRQELYHIYKDLLLAQQVPWAEIMGDYETRFLRAVDAVNSHFGRAK